MNTYREESLQRNIARIRNSVLEMSQQAEKALRDCIKAYSENDRQIAYAVILRDQHIDAKEKEIDRLCLEFLVREQPVGGPLRFAYSTIRINLEIERIGDYAESIARQLIKFHDRPNYLFKDSIIELAKLSISMFHDSIKAFLNQDAALAKKSSEIEVTVDALRNDLNHDLMNLLNEQKISYEDLSLLITIIRKFERVSDQARNICMEILYMCTGEIYKHPGSDAIRILFLDDFNSCQSQMAEAIAYSLNQPKFIFSSAGINPKAVCRQTIDFMKTKGIDLSRNAPKTLHEIPNLEHYQVIIALSETAASTIQQLPKKVIFLDWSVVNPTDKSLSALAASEAYEEAYVFIKEQITDLLNAINDHDSKDQGVI